MNAFGLRLGAPGLLVAGLVVAAAIAAGAWKFSAGSSASATSRVSMPDPQLGTPMPDRVFRSTEGRSDLQTVTGLEPDRRYVVRQGDSAARPLSLPRVRLGGSARP